MPTNPILARVQRRLAGRAITMAGPLAQQATAVELVPLVAEVLEALGQSAEGLTPQNAVEWLNGFIGQLKAETATTGGEVDQAAFLMSLSGGADVQRLQIAKGIAKRRNITLADALKFVPQ